MQIPEDSQHIFISNRRFEEAGMDGANRLLQSAVPYTAAICAYDNIAFGLIKQLKKCNYQVPRDFSVIGMNDIRSTAYAETSLTSISEISSEICLALWDLLKKKMNNKYFMNSRPIVLTSELVVRDSVGPAPK
jgi:DNA-binding LacI/PurR family transcriptional regulator